MNKYLDFKIAILLFVHFYEVFLKLTREYIHMYSHGSIIKKYKRKYSMSLLPCHQPYDFPPQQQQMKIHHFLCSLPAILCMRQQISQKW